MLGLFSIFWRCKEFLLSSTSLKVISTWTHGTPGKNRITFWMQVADFGLAAELEPGKCSASIKQPTNALWVAPEVLQAGAHCEVTKASDVYSLGCVMYECLTGKVPHWDESSNIAADVVSDSMGFVLYQALKLSHSARCASQQYTRQP